MLIPTRHRLSMNKTPLKFSTSPSSYLGVTKRSLLHLQQSPWLLTPSLRLLQMPQNKAKIQQAKIFIVAFGTSCCVCKMFCLWICQTFLKASVSPSILILTTFRAISNLPVARLRGTCAQQICYSLIIRIIQVVLVIGFTRGIRLVWVVKGSRGNGLILRRGAENEGTGEIGGVWWSCGIGLFR